jgi:hypothetical protein
MDDEVAPNGGAGRADRRIILAGTITASLAASACHAHTVQMQPARSWSLRLLAFLLLVQWGTAFTQCLELTDSLAVARICSASESPLTGKDQTPGDRSPAGKAHNVCPVCQILGNITPPPPPPTFGLPAGAPRIVVVAAYFASFAPLLRVSPLQARAPPTFS